MRKILVLAAAFATLTACGDGQNARDILGLGKKTPDEFRVVARPPLSTPPDFTLRPPEEGLRNPTLIGNAAPADSRARALVTRDEDLLDVTQDFDTQRYMGPADTAVGVVSSYDLATGADQQFLSNLGAKEADPAIRDKIFEEHQANVAINEEEKSEYLFDWLVPTTQKDEVIVDAKKEKERLDAAKAAEQPVTAGETPVIEPKTQSVLGDLF